MLEIQKHRIYEANRLRAHGASEDEIEALKDAGNHPFRPAFVGGKRRTRLTDATSGTFEVPIGQLAIPSRKNEFSRFA
jgi:hypothetical protein